MLFARSLRFTPLLLALSLSSAAWADVSDADRATARALAQEGQTALEKKDFATAADRFARADALIHAPTLLLGRARALVGLGKLVEAQEAYERIVREGVAANAPAPFQRALEDAKGEVQALAPRLAWVTITVRGADGAAVTLDGAPVPKAALGVKRAVNPGKHVVRATAGGYADAEAAITMAEGGAQPVALTLEKRAVAVAAPTSTATATSTSTPISTPTDATPETGKGRGQRTAGFVALGVGGAGLVVGSIAGILAMGKHASLADACPGGACPADQQSTLDSYRTMGTISTVGFAVGLVGAGAGAVLLLTAPRPSDSVAIAPFIGVGTVGARGVFQ